MFVRNVLSRSWKPGQPDLLLAEQKNSVEAMAVMASDKFFLRARYNTKDGVVDEVIHRETGDKRFIREDNHNIDKLPEDAKLMQSISLEKDI